MIEKIVKKKSGKLPDSFFEVGSLIVHYKIRLFLQAVTPFDKADGS